MRYNGGSYCILAKEALLSWRSAHVDMWNVMDNASVHPLEYRTDLHKTSSQNTVNILQLCKLRGKPDMIGRCTFAFSYESSMSHLRRIHESSCYECTNNFAA